MSADLITSTFLQIRNRLMHTARKMLDDDNDADDALQESFFKLWQHRQNIVSCSQAEGLSVVTVRNTCLDMLRRRKHNSNIPIEQAGTELNVADEDCNENIELYETVREIIDNCLTDRERTVITMRDSMGMTFEDIAEELGVTETNARMILSRARKAVRSIYLSSYNK